ncbi:hypothetical protein OG233_17405 [Streptomyces sp. NBC_01218]|uniref:hypothetical protein n=1 Tax=unclassified Streptomyces TaxID=2593676 RepID=UPI002E141E1F|nr:hypothetical protein OG233_17405 [Streptomyces sp. NBC_01218]
MWSSRSASSPARTYAPTSAMPELRPEKKDGAYAASPTSATRPVDQRGQRICQAMGRSAG